MKIAVLFFGQVKNWCEDQATTFRDHFEPSLEEHDVDYILCTSRRESYTSLRNQAVEGKNIPIDYASIMNFIEMHREFYDGLEDMDHPVNKKIDEITPILAELGKPWGAYTKDATRNALRQAYCLEYMHQRFVIKHEYDAFILLRSDCYFTEGLPRIDKLVDKCKPRMGLVPSHCWWEGGCNDRFLLTTDPYVFSVYCSRFSAILSQPEYYHAEQYLLKHMYRHRINIEKIPSWTFRLIRANGVVTNLGGRNPDKKLTEKMKKNFTSEGLLKSATY